MGRKEKKRRAADAAVAELAAPTPPAIPVARLSKTRADLSEEDARAFADAWIAAWNSHDLDAILSHYTRHVELTSPLVTRRFGPDGRGTVRGRDALREYFDIGLRSVPDLHFALRHVLSGPSGVALVYERENGALTLETIELTKKGKARRVQVYYHGLPELPPD
jgi:hypothetical protein